METSQAKIRNLLSPFWALSSLVAMPIPVDKKAEWEKNLLETAEQCNANKKEILTLLDKTEEEAQEWEASFDLYHEAALRGTAIYRELNPDYPVLSHPDTGKMINALCDEIQSLNTQLEDACQRD